MKIMMCDSAVEFVSMTSGQTRKTVGTEMMLHHDLWQAADNMSTVVILIMSCLGHVAPKCPGIFNTTMLGHDTSTCLMGHVANFLAFLILQCRAMKLQHV